MNKEVENFNTINSTTLLSQQALPPVAPVLDITHIKGHASALEWIKTLFDASAESYPRYLEPSFERNQQLQSFFFQSRNDLKTHGQHSFSLGYPFLAMHSEGKDYAFPLFLWEVKMTPEKGLNRWQLQLLPQSMEVNPFAIYFLKEKTGLNLLNLFCYKELQFANSVKDYTIFFNQLISDYDLATDSEKISIAPCPEWPLDIPREQLQLFWCGVLGNFPKGALPKEYDSELVNKDLLEPTPPFGYGYLSPRLDGINNSILRNKIAVVNTKHPSHSDELIDFLLTNALAQGQRNLVISNKLPFLKRIETSLNKKNILEQIFLLTHPKNDLAVLLNRARAIVKKTDKAPNEDKEYSVIEDKLWRLHKKMYRQHKALKKPVFGHFNRAEVGAFFLHESQDQNPSVLDAHLSSEGFEFSPIELEGIISALGHAKQLYNDKISFNHPLNNLHIDIFKGKDKDEALAFIQERLFIFTNKGKKLHQQYVEHRNTYSNRLTNYYGELYRKIYTLTEGVQEQIKDFSSRYPNPWKTNSDLRLSLRGLLSKEARTAKKQLEEIKTSYQDLSSIFTQENLFEFDFIPSSSTLADITTNIIAFEKEVELWRHRLSTRIEDELLRLSHKTAIESLDPHLKTAQLEQELNLYGEELNNVALYQLPQQGKMLTLKLRQKYLEQILEQMEDTRFHLKDFENFFQWQKFWFSLPQKYRQAVKATIKANPANWEQTFKSWYFQQCFRLSYDPVLPEVEFEVEEYFQLWTQIQSKLPWVIEKNNWTNQQISLKNIQKEDKQTWAYLTDIKNKPTLEELLQAGEIMSLFPVVLATPYMAQQLSTTTDFDNVIIDNTLNDVDLNNYIHLGQRNMILTTHGNSAVSIANIPQHWIQEVSLPIDLKQRARFIEQSSLIQLNGRFESHNQTNPEEAQHILRLLNKITPNQHNIYPKVGIVCMTRAQRNLLMSYLWEIQEQRSPGFEKIQQLERNGMGVFTLEEAIQHHFDIAIWSITFGRTGIHEELTNAIAYWDEPLTTQHLKMLLHQPIQQRYIINSISERDLKYLANKSKTQGGGGVFMSMLLTLCKQSTSTSIIDTDIEEGKWPTMVKAILPYVQLLLPQDKVEVERDNPEVLWINDKAIYLFANGCFSSSASTNFIWEYYKKRDLENKNVIIYNFLPTEWVKTPQQAATKLVEYVLQQIDGEV